MDSDTRSVAESVDTNVSNNSKTSLLGKSKRSDGKKKKDNALRSITPLSEASQRSVSGIILDSTSIAHSSSPSSTQFPNSNIIKATPETPQTLHGGSLFPTHANEEDHEEIQ